MEEFAKNIDVSFYAYNLSLILQNIYWHLRLNNFAFFFAVHEETLIILVWNLKTSVNHMGQLK
jgi:hypothetical protein